MRPATALEPMALYNYLYSHALPNGRGLYGGHDRRAGFFIKHMEEYCKPPAKVLDSSCGRGFILKWLLASGYDASGTEVATWLTDSGGDLYGLPVEIVSYEEFDLYADNRWDVVISNDVLEHLFDEDRVIFSLQNLARVSRNWLLVSTGGIRQAHCPFPEEVGTNILHYVVKPREWWLEQFKAVCNLHTEFKATGSLFMFGKPK